MSPKIIDIAGRSRRQDPNRPRHARISGEPPESLSPEDELKWVTVTHLELGALELFFGETDEDRRDMELAAGEAFGLLKTIPRPDDGLEAGSFLLRAGMLATLAGETDDAVRWLRKSGYPELPVDSQDPMEHFWATAADAWLRLLFASGRDDFGLALERISGARTDELAGEKGPMRDDMEPMETLRIALEMLVIGHLTKAAQVLAHHMTDGTEDEKPEVWELLETHFSQALNACRGASMTDLEPLFGLLGATALEMAENPAPDG